MIFLMFNSTHALSLQRTAPSRVLCWTPTVYPTLQQVIPRVLSLVAANTHTDTLSRTYSICISSLSSFDIPLYSSSDLVNNTLLLFRQGMRNLYWNSCVAKLLLQPRRVRCQRILVENYSEKQTATIR